MISLFSRKRASTLALAISLATGSAVVAVAVLPAEASAQRVRERERERSREAPQQAESTGGGYSDAFRAAYQPLNEAIQVQGADLTPMRGQFSSLVGLLTTADEKIAGGGLVYNAGARMRDRPLQRAGLQAMLTSGLVPAANLGQYNFIAYQLANQDNDLPAARSYLQGAIDNNFVSETVSAAQLRIAMAESYFAGNDFSAGFTYLEQAIADRKAQGLTVDEDWYRRGVTVSYNNKIVPQVYDFVTMWVTDYPSTTNWRDAINVTRNLNTFDSQEMLDLFRLGRRLGALTDASDYDYYVEAADARRLPLEVKQVIEEGIDAGVVSEGNLFITEALETANGRIAADRADLPDLEAAAKVANAQLRTVTAAASAFLSYGEYDKASNFYQRALGMPGVDTNEALTRLGIAQIGLGDYAAARSSFAQVGGNRASIAKLWITYADQLEGSASTAM